MDCSPSQACVMVSFVSDCIQSDDPNIARTALTDLRGVDHVGITVPDMQEAEDFLVDVLGAVPVYSLPGKSANDDWMSEHLAFTLAPPSRRSGSTDSVTAATSRCSPMTQPTVKRLTPATAMSEDITWRSMSTTSTELSITCDLAGST